MGQYEHGWQNFSLVFIYLAPLVHLYQSALYCIWVCVVLNTAGFQLLIAECFLQLMIKPKVPKRKCARWHKIYCTSLCPCPWGAFKLEIFDGTQWIKSCKITFSLPRLMSYHKVEHLCRVCLCQCVPMCHLPVGLGLIQKGNKEMHFMYRNSLQWEL